jgi:hypothetical protein
MAIFPDLIDTPRFALTFLPALAAKAFPVAFPPTQIPFPFCLTTAGSGTVELRGFRGYEVL